ncbi:MAG: GerAB/ArcD/ProY family transporter [Bacillota bacterium]
MKLEGGEISNLGLFFLVVGFTWGSAILTSPATQAGSDGWLVSLAGMLAGLVAAYIFTSLAGYFPGSTLTEINRQVYGPLLGGLFSIAYIFYFLLLSTLILRTFSDFWVGFIFPATPDFILDILFVLVCASAVRNGIEVITRCSVFMVPLTFLLFLFTISLSIKDIDLTNFFPIFDLPVKEFIKITHHMAVFPYGETIVFIVVLAFLNNNSKTGRIPVLGGIVFAGLSLTMLIMRNIGLLGETLSIGVYGSYTAVRMINIGEVFTRIEIFVALNFLAMGFVMLSVFYYAAVLSTGELLKMRTYLPLVLPMGIVLIVLNTIEFESMLERIQFSADITPWLGLFFQFFFPLVTLVLGKMKKR